MTADSQNLKSCQGTADGPPGLRSWRESIASSAVARTTLRDVPGRVQLGILRSWSFCECRWSTWLLSAANDAITTKRHNAEDAGVAEDRRGLQV